MIDPLATVKQTAATAQTVHVWTMRQRFFSGEAVAGPQDQRPGQKQSWLSK